MSKIKLTGSNSGYVEISSAADAGNITLALPTSGTKLLSDVDNVYTGITTFTNDVKFEGGSYDVLWDASDNQLEFGDNAKLSFGASLDLQLFHDGNNSIIKSNTNILLLQTDIFQLKSADNTEHLIGADKDGSVRLNYNGNVKVETTNTGAVVTGICTATSFSGSGENLTRTTQFSHRNKIINGAMTISQRQGTSSNNQTADNTYPIDRFNHIIRGTFNGTYVQSTDAPDGFKYSLKVNPTSTYTPSGSDNACITQFIEGQDLQDLASGTSSAKSITLSFYAKTGSTNNGDQYSIQFRKFGSANMSVTAAFTATSSWQRFSFSFAGDTANTMIDTNAAGMQLLFHLAAGPDDIISAYNTWTAQGLFRAVTGQSNFLDNTSNEFYLTGVQVEVGEQATPFEHRSHGEELARCQRYFQFVEYAQAMARTSTNTGAVWSKFTCEMRATPTIGTMNISTKATNVGLNLQGDGSTNTTQSSGNQGTSYSSQRSMYLYDISGFGGMTAGRTYVCGIPANNAVVFTANAEQ